MLTIGKVARQADVSADTLRYYEREGLLAPERKTASGYRLYADDSISRLHFIKQAQACGFTLAEIRELIALRQRGSACCADVRTRTVEKKLQLEGQIRTLKTMSKALDSLIAACVDETHPVNKCPILSSLEERAAPKRRARRA